MVDIRDMGNNRFDVTVSGSSKTTHKVSVDPAYWQKLTGGKITPEELVRRSFDFLLDREPNTSILSTFDLPVIGRYFPEYEGEMKKQVG